MFEGDFLDAVGKEADEDVRFDAFVGLVVDKAYVKAAYEFFEGLFDFGESNVFSQKFFGAVGDEMGSQQGDALASSGATFEFVKYPGGRAIDFRWNSS